MRKSRSRLNRLEKLMHFGMVNFKDGDLTGTGEGGAITQEDVTKHLAAALATQQTKNDTDNEGLKNKNTELLTAADANKLLLKSIEGIDVPELISLRDKIAGDEILTLLADGKSQEALDAHTERLTVNHNAALETSAGLLKTATEEGAADRTQLHGLLVDGEAVKALIGAKGLKEAIPDAVARAKNIFKVERQEDGTNLVTARGEDGKILQGADGALTFTEWAEGLKKTAPHFFPASKGGLAIGGDADENGFTGSDAELMKATAEGPDALRAYKLKIKEAKKKK